MRRGGAVAALLVLPFAPQAAAAAPVTADQAMTNYRSTFRSVAELRCPKAEGAEIVVCARPEGPDPNRVPFPDEHDPGARVGLLPGEPPSATEALARTDRSACAAAGPNHSCGGSISLFSLLFGVIKVAKAVHDRHAD
jgi:hypothetical protein